MAWYWILPLASASIAGYVVKILYVMHQEKLIPEAMLSWKENIPSWSWMNLCVLRMAETFRKWTADLETDGNEWEQMEQKFSPAELGLLAEQIHITIKRDIVVRGEHLMGTSIELNNLAYFLCLFSSDMLKCSECIKLWLCILYVCPAFQNAPGELPRYWGDGKGLLQPQGTGSASCSQCSLRWTLLPCLQLVPIQLCLTADTDWARVSVRELLAAGPALGHKSHLQQ